MTPHPARAPSLGRPLGAVTIRLPDPAVPPPTPEQKRCPRPHASTAAGPCEACGWTPSGLARGAERGSGG